jgi:hypothetical protein
MKLSNNFCLCNQLCKWSCDPICAGSSEISHFLVLAGFIFHTGHWIKFPGTLPLPPQYCFLVVFVYYLVGGYPIYPCIQFQSSLNNIGGDVMLHHFDTCFITWPVTEAPFLEWLDGAVFLLCLSACNWNVIPCIFQHFLKYSKPHWVSNLLLQPLLVMQRAVD